MTRDFPVNKESFLSAFSWHEKIPSNVESIKPLEDNPDIFDYLTQISDKDSNASIAAQEFGITCRTSDDYYGAFRQECHSSVST